MKAPVEIVVGTVRLAGSYRTPTFGIHDLADQVSYMGQDLLRPPSVEGWHEGLEWIDSGTLVERVNFGASELGNVQNPGVRAIIERLATENGGVLSPGQLVDRCLDLVGPVPVSEETRSMLLDFAAKDGDLDLRGHQPSDEAEQRVGVMLGMVASTKEYQFA